MEVSLTLVFYMGFKVWNINTISKILNIEVILSYKIDTLHSEHFIACLFYK